MAKAAKAVSRPRANRKTSTILRSTIHNTRNRALPALPVNDEARAILAAFQEHWATKPDIEANNAFSKRMEPWAAKIAKRGTAADLATLAVFVALGNGAGMAHHQLVGLCLRSAGLSHKKLAGERYRITSPHSAGRPKVAR